MDKSHAGIPGPSGAVKSELTHLTGRMTRRQTALTVLRGLALWAALFASGTLLALAADALWNLGTALFPLLAGLGAMALVAAAAVVRRFRRGPARLLLLADREIGGEEQLTTAYELLADRPQHPLLPALLQRCKPLVARVDPRRVLPFALGGPEWAAGGSILVALAVFFAAAYWPEGPPSAGRRMREAVRQEGRRIQQMADRLEAAAERDSFFQVSQLTPRLRAAAMAFQRDEVEPAGAVQRLFDLSGEAARLAAEAAGPGNRASGAAAEDGSGAEAVSQVADRGEAERFQSPPLAEGAPRSGVDPIQVRVDRVAPPEGLIENTTNVPTTQDMTALGEMTQRSPFSPPPRESELLRLAEEDLEAAANELERLIASSRGTPTPSSLGEESEGDAITLDDASPSDRSRPASSESNPAEARPGDSGRYGRVDETYSEATGNVLPGEAPEETGFFDARVRGAPGASRVETVIMSQRPGSGTRTIPLEFHDGEFRRVPVVVDGGAEIPREYWPILRAYFDRLREAKRGQALSNGTPGLQ